MEASCSTMLTGRYTTRQMEKVRLLCKYLLTCLGTLPWLMSHSILYSLESLGNVRYFFVFIMAISTLNNNIFNLYSISISMQLFGKWTTYVPRMIWNLVGAIVVFLIAIIGRDSIYTIIGNSVAVIAYWTAIFFAIILIEDRFFRRRTAYDHSGWDDSGKLPKGYAAMLAFGIGAAGSIIGMGQTWYYG